MTNTEKRADFLRMLGELLRYAGSLGIRLICVDFDRSPEEQEQLVKAGRSTTLHSKHLHWLAIDLVVLDDDGKLVWDADDWRYNALGSYWEGLGGVWGGRWKMKDGVHFEVR